ncbi:flagellar protein [Shinella sp. SUS2]|jgi:flagellar motility protein MotE (MotC chaperone)|uniref:MotE family protein n=1 Tax=unclassified Shinella TaxID=2643062 RepID=UPI000682BF5D|nr:MULTISPECIES: MotE family protein [unclassified Shinella]KNY14846.1 flagellar protein [Shinella sp. SUS2]KOC74499.1 flagellar protein [Shinella sp. GWS1]TAA60667.1 flagellar protein [Shinella sp. JR1-6]
MTDVTTLTAVKTLARKLALPLAGFVLMAIPGAFAEERPVIMTTKATADEIREFCTNIADAARDQRYLLQKQELENLQKDIDARIKTLETRRAEYEDWLNRRNNFLKTAEGGLVEIYRKMKPDAAAAQLAEINPEIASAIVMKLPPRQSSTILAEMPADKAALLTRLIAIAGDPNTSKAKDPS